MYEAFIEASSFVAESEAIYALAVPRDYIGNAMNLEQVSILSSDDNWTGLGHGGYGSICAMGFSHSEEYRLDILIKFPGLLKTTVAKALSREPRAIVYTSIYYEQE